MGGVCGGTTATKSLSMAKIKKLAARNKKGIILLPDNEVFPLTMSWLLCGKYKEGGERLRVAERNANL